MPISNTQIRVNYTGDGTSTSFPIPFSFYLDTDIQVLLGTAPQSTGYSISGGEDSSGNPQPGTLTFSTPPAAQVAVQAVLNVPLTQLVELVDGTAFPSSTINQVNDRSIQAALRLSDRLSRAILAPDGDVSPVVSLPAAASRANTFLGFDSNGNISLGQTLPSGTLSQSTIGGFLWPLTAAEQAAGVKPVNYAYAPGNVLRYGADPTGVNDSTNAFNQAITQASQLGSSSAEVFIPGGTYLVGGLTINANGITFRGSGMGLTVLKANANGIWVLKVAQSNCIVDSLTIDGNGHASVDGLVFAPANESVTNTVNFNDYCTVSSVQIQNCNNGLRMRAGPTVSGTDSGCFYNQFWGVFFLNCVRSIWLQNSVANGNGGPNRGTFTACRVGSAGNVCNTGLQIDSGATNQFFGVHFEGINNGTSPSAIPTAVVIARTASSGLDNNENQFFGCMLEANTLDLNNLNVETEIYGGVWAATKFAVGNVAPLVMLTGTPSQEPFIVPGLQYGEGLAGFPSGYWGMTKEIADAGFPWQVYALSTATNVTGMATIGAGAVSAYRQQSSMVDWHFTCAFNATSGGSQILITPPIVPNAALYTTLQSSNAFFTFYVNNGSGLVQTSGGFTSAGKLFINAPSGNWNTSGNNNALFCEVRYHI